MNVDEMNTCSLVAYAIGPGWVTTCPSPAGGGLDAHLIPAFPPLVGCRGVSDDMLFGWAPFYKALGVALLQLPIGEFGLKRRMLVGEEHALLPAGEAVPELQTETTLVVDDEPDWAPQAWHAERGTPYGGNVVRPSAEELLDQEEHL
ncbi:MAG: hypothetical protein HZA54_07415 [Planctomycetes bacterium]|nr:hypothetical protein [Planctomycetota bacterium]